MDQVKMYMMMFENQHHFNKYQNPVNLRNFYSPIHTQPNIDRYVENPSDQLKSSKIKLCKVCGDVARSLHFGSLSCCSCKAFFRRSVQNESYKNFHCPYNSNCEITILSRKCCQFCRFEKCVRMGMEKSWVMSSEERLQLLKRMLKKQKKEQENTFQMNKSNESSQDSMVDDSSQNSDLYLRETVEYHADYSLINNYLTDHEINRIERLVNDYLISCVQIQPKFLIYQTMSSFNSISCDKIRLVESAEEMIQLFLNCVYQFAKFAKKLDFFQNLNLQDQQVLLRNSIIELCFLRAAFSFDREMFHRTVLIKRNNFSSTNDENQLIDSHSNQNSLFYDHQIKSQNHSQTINQTRSQIRNQNKENLSKAQDDYYEFKKRPILRKENLIQFLQLDEQLSNKFFNFIKQIQECRLDEVIVILMTLIVLFNPERIQLIGHKSITKEQELYLDLLNRYINWKFSSNLSSTVFAKLLMTLPNLRELSELFAEFQLENNVLNRFSFDESNHLDENCFSFRVDNKFDLLDKIFKIKNLID